MASYAKNSVNRKQNQNGKLDVSSLEFNQTTWQYLLFLLTGNIKTSEVGWFGLNSNVPWSIIFLFIMGS